MAKVKQQTEEPAGVDLTKKDTFIQEIEKMAAETKDGVEKAKEFENLGMIGFEEPEGQALVTGSTFWSWRDDNDKPFLGKVFVGVYLGEHAKPEDSANSFPGELLGYDFKGADGVDYILGDNYSLKQALHETIEINGVPTFVKELKTPVLWIKLIAVDPSKKGDFNRFKIKLVKHGS